HRCPCGLPDVVRTTPRLADGRPFPTLFYLTCPRAVAACSRLESAGLMKEMNARLAADPQLAGRYHAAHEDYLARRAELGEVPEIAGVSAGGMPTRVKCLHALLGHATSATSAASSTCTPPSAGCCPRRPSRCTRTCRSSGSRRTATRWSAAVRCT